MWLSGLLIAGSLLAVVVGDALLTQGQVRLATTQRALVGAVATQKSFQTETAQKAAPPRVVGEAKSHGLVAATQVVYLPEVPLNVPLPPPRLVPTSRRTATPSTTPPASNATPSALASRTAAATPSVTTTTAGR
jgi:hypothetical protein